MDDERQILRLFEDGDRALISADAAEIKRIYADDYLQYDETGKASDRDDLIEKLAAGALRFLSMHSTGRTVRLLGDFAIVHGSEDDVFVQAGVEISVRYLYTDVVVRRNGRWQIVASQLVKISGQSEGAINK